MSRPKRYAKRAVWLGVTGVSIYLIIPSVISTFSSWPELQRLREGSLLIMAALTVISIGFFWLLLGLCLRTRGWWLIATSQLASAAIAKIVPGGSATATAVQYRLLNEGGIDKATAGSGLTVATLLNFAVLFAMPIFTLPAILFGPPIDAALVNGAVAAALSFVAASVISGVFLGLDRPLITLGNTIDWVAARLRRLDDDAPPQAERLIDSRNMIRSYLADRWYWVVLASFGKWAFDYLALVMAVRGTGHDDTTSGILLAFVTASLLGRIPLTPGGLGFVEAGLTGMLVLAGVGAGDAATATLAYRLVSYWIPIPVGGLAYGLYRIRERRRGIDLPRLADYEATDQKTDRPLT